MNTTTVSQTSHSSSINKLEPIVYLLSFLMVFFTGILFIAEYFYHDDGQLFQVISGLLTGISGAFLMRIKPQAAPVLAPVSPTLTPNPPDQTVTASLTPATPTPDPAS